jgi:hypothetical protein
VRGGSVTLGRCSMALVGDFVGTQNRSMSDLGYKGHNRGQVRHGWAGRILQIDSVRFRSAP